MADACKTCNGAGKHDCEDGGACEHHGAPCPACAPSPSAAGGEARESVPAGLALALDRLVDVAGEEGYHCNVYRENKRIKAAKEAVIIEALAARPSSEPRPRCGVVLTEDLAPCSRPAGHAGGHFWAPHAPQAPEVRTVPSEPQGPTLTETWLSETERDARLGRMDRISPGDVERLVSEVRRLRASGGVRERVEAKIDDMEREADYLASQHDREKAMDYRRAAAVLRAALGETTDGSANGGE